MSPSPRVNATIDVTTVDTGVQPRDNDLKSANYFDVANFPTATFTSTGVARNGNELTVTGNLTLHGVTKPVVLDVEGPTGRFEGMDHKPHAGFSATTTISRTAFGIGSKVPCGHAGRRCQAHIELERQAVSIDPAVASDANQLGPGRMTQEFPMASLKSEIAQKPPFSSVGRRGASESSAHLRLPATRLPAENPRLGTYHDAVQRAAHSARRAAAGAGLRGHRRTHGHRRARHYAPAGAPERRSN